MKLIHNFYLALLVLLSSATIVYTYDEEIDRTEIKKEIERLHEDKENLEEKIDNELFEVFYKFFDKEDHTPFIIIINKIVAMLKLKKESLQGIQKTKCQEIIKTFETNKCNHNFAIWVRIMINSNQDLQELMSERTRNYINNIKTETKFQALIAKLQQK